MHVRLLTSVKKNIHDILIVNSSALCLHYVLVQQRLWLVRCKSLSLRQTKTIFNWNIFFFALFVLGECVSKLSSFVEAAEKCSIFATAAHYCRCFVVCGKTSPSAVCILWASTSFKFCIHRSLIWLWIKCKIKLQIAVFVTSIFCMLFFCFLFSL